MSICSHEKKLAGRCRRQEYILKAIIVTGLHTRSHESNEKHVSLNVDLPEILLSMNFGISKIIFCSHTFAEICGTTCDAKPGYLR
jgi:hypothetical protein